MKTQLKIAQISLLVAVLSVAGVVLVWDNFDAGFIRFGIVVPAFLFWYSLTRYRVYKELKREWEYRNSMR